ncbi:MAG: TerB family tellurite resistance protein [Helicobacter sp.]|nr:TerB family tellurite resistance protein [Helicobacter sp.]
MEIILLITIVIVALAIINFKDYLSNPSKRPKIKTYEEELQILKQQEIYASPSKEEKIRDSEYGLMVGIMAKLAQSDGRVCELESEMIENTLSDIASQLALQSAMNQKEEILQILRSIFADTSQNTEELTRQYANLTKGQYKTRLKLVEYLFALAYADGSLVEEEREIILDVAAFLEIENSDFNFLYDRFAEFYGKLADPYNLEESCKILGVQKDDDLEVIKKAYKKLVREYHPDILHHKGLDKSMIDTSVAKLQDINAAYENIKEYKKQVSQ